jgi:hypothetical protein
LPPVPAQSHGDAGLAKTTHDIAVAPGAAAALREHVKVSADKLDQRLQRLMEAEAKAQQALDVLLRSQHAAIEANSKATDQLAGAIADLRAALIESTKL